MRDFYRDGLPTRVFLHCWVGDTTDMYRPLVSGSRQERDAQLSGRNGSVATVSAFGPTFRNSFLSHSSRD